MNKKETEKLLHEVRSGNISVDEALERLKNLPFTDLGYALVDNHRELRTGYPEIIYCAGKTVSQVTGIFSAMAERGSNVIGTRATPGMYEAVQKLFPSLVYSDVARIISLTREKQELPETKIAVVTAGTSDMPVAEEAAVTAELLGNKVERIYDAGVAGIHRLFARIEIIRSCKVIVVIAGMEGALASVVSGLVDKPVIAVPTSVGYGANFGGVSALLAMLTSCSAGVTVVNIDNGFGAGFTASMINKL